jgi:hypothetical protein
MKPDNTLTITSLLAIVLMSFHMADDVFRGYEPGGLKNLNAILIMVVWLYATLALTGPRLRYVILRYVIILLGSLLAAVMPAAHFRGAGIGARITESSGGLFFIWTLFALGVTGTFSAILSVRGLWRLRRGQPVTGSPENEGQVRTDANVEAVR